MKNLIVIVAIVIFTACEKNYTCTCTHTVYTDHDTTSFVDVSQMKNTKKQMKILCKDGTWKEIYQNGERQQTVVSGCSIQ